jgi:glycosyltransferase involved in cell wall biosynthesis
MGGGGIKVTEALEQPSRRWGVSVVVCSHRSRSRLERTLPAWFELDQVQEVIVVDAPSGDGTAHLVASLAQDCRAAVRLIAAPLRGLANARNLGSRAATCDLVLHAGPDNIVPEGVLEEMIEQLRTHDLVSCSTVLAEPRTYFDRAHDLSKRRLPTGRIRTVVGTPYIARHALFIEHPFNEVMKHADDTELCTRLLAHGLRIYRSPLACLEVGYTSFADLRERWGRWGASDSQFYIEMRDSWTWRRRLRSRFRGFIAEVIEPRRALSRSEYLYGLPFFLLAALFRTGGWLREAGER